MKAFIDKLIETERRHADIVYMTEVIQGGRSKPKKYKHYLKIPLDLYFELVYHKVLNTEDYFTDQSAFFEFNSEYITINMHNLYQCEDLHRKIDHYIIRKLTGGYPIIRGGIFICESD